MGVFVAPPGVGKTVLGTYLAAKRARSTLVLVHRRPLLDQWVAQLSMFLRLDEKKIGQIGGGKRKPNGRLDVATCCWACSRNGYGPTERSDTPVMRRHSATPR
jgi:superfamily II DNA or RNA helicase